MTAEIISVLAAFAPQFTRPTWKNIQTLFLGAILCRGARRVTSILPVMGLMPVVTTFGLNIILAIRRSIGEKQHFSKSASNDDFVKFNAQEISYLINHLSLPA